MIFDRELFVLIVFISILPLILLIGEMFFICSVNNRGRELERTGKNRFLL